MIRMFEWEIEASGGSTLPLSDEVALGKRESIERQIECESCGLARSLDIKRCPTRHLALGLAGQLWAAYF
jgi:hypothetical protein